jgi:DNA invertase Pin-like site-specific DNA recombinase
VLLAGFFPKVFSIPADMPPIGGIMTTNQAIPAAQYLRMSTEHQQYSLENQSLAIQKYADSHGFEVVRTYSDAAKSGLVLRLRTGLQQLLRDVVGGASGYGAILVYDVSRWRRFQDTDESAHYEFLCKSAGVPVHYCAETFANDGTLPSLIMKALKRTMAGEYSRDLSVRVFAGLKRLALLGFKTGGVPGYGLRRMLVSASGVPKQELGIGERKSIATDRVILVPGPANEIQTVKDIYRMYISERRSLCSIARKLNSNGVLRPGHSKWDFSGVRMILTHPKYVGCAVFGQVSKKLNTPAVKVPKTEWVLRPGAFEPIVDPATFADAQKALGRHRCQRTDDDLLDDLRRLLASEGRLSFAVIKNSFDVMSPGTYSDRFGGLRKAYKLVGYDYPHRRDGADTRLQTMALRKELISQIAAMFPNEVSIVRPGVHRRTRLRIFNRITVSVLISRQALVYKNTRRWMVEPVRQERKFITLLARLDEGNRAIVDLHVFPNIDRSQPFQISDAWMKRGKCFAELSRFCEVVAEAQRGRRSKRQTAHL